MLNRTTLITVLAALAALAAAVLPAAASARTGAIVFSLVRTVHPSEVEAKAVEGEGEAVEPKALEGGLYASREGRLNQLTEDPDDSEPDFAADGRTIAFARGGDIWAMRADGSGQRQLTSGPEVDGRPLVAPNGRYVLFERRRPWLDARNLFTVSVEGGEGHAVVVSDEDEHDATFSADGKKIFFVRSTAETGGGTADDIYSVRPSGARKARLTRTARIDEFAPRQLGETIVFSRGESTEGPSAYADIYTMRDDGRKLRKLIAGAIGASG